MYRSTQDDEIYEFVSAAGRGDITALKNYISKNINVNSKNHLGHTALAEAVINGRVDSLDTLIENKADINQKINGKPILILSVMSNSDECTEKLLEVSNLKINEMDTLGLTALEYFSSPFNKSPSGDDAHVKTLIKFLSRDDIDINSCRRASTVAANETKEILQNYIENPEAIRNHLKENSNDPTKTVTLDERGATAASIQKSSEIKK